MSQALLLTHPWLLVRVESSGLFAYAYHFGLERVLVGIDAVILVQNKLLMRVIV